MQAYCTGHSNISTPSLISACFFTVGIQAQPLIKADTHAHIYVTTLSPLFLRHCWLLNGIIVFPFLFRMIISEKEDLFKHSHTQYNHSPLLRFLAFSCVSVCSKLINLFPPTTLTFNLYYCIVLLFFLLLFFAT